MADQQALIEKVKKVTSALEPLMIGRTIQDIDLLVPHNKGIDPNKQLEVQYPDYIILVAALEYLQDLQSTLPEKNSSEYFEDQKTKDIIKDAAEKLQPLFPDTPKPTIRMR